MKITKLGHCCLLIEVSGKRIMTDPGRFSDIQNEIYDLDIILITHEHADHLHAESLQIVLQNNPKAVVVTNTSVGAVLSDIGIAYRILEGSDTAEIDTILLEAYDGQHVEIFEEYGQVQNTGYFIAEKLFYPGDAYTEPQKPVPVLALPVSGPWCKLSEAVAYTVRVNPERSFPVHDAVLNDEGVKLVHGLFKSQLQVKNIDFTPLLPGESLEF